MSLATGYAVTVPIGDCVAEAKFEALAITESKRAISAAHNDGLVPSSAIPASVGTHGKAG